MAMAENPFFGGGNSFKMMQDMMQGAFRGFSGRSMFGGANIDDMISSMQADIMQGKSAFDNHQGSSSRFSQMQSMTQTKQDGVKETY